MVFMTAILGLERIHRFQADVTRGLSCIAKLDSQIKLGMTGYEKEIASKARIAVFMNIYFLIITY